MSLKAGEVWEARKGKKKTAGASAAEIKKWETAHGVKLPALLRDALKIQNGGKVRYATIELHPLAEIAPLDEAFWSYAYYSKKKFADKRIVFGFGESTDGEPLYILNFNAKGPKGEP